MASGPGPGGWLFSVAKLLHERAACPRRESTPAIDPENLFVEPSTGGTTRDSVRQRRDAARPRRHRLDVADRTRLQRRAVTAVVIGEKLALESRDVDADGAFGLARAALETEIEDLAHSFVAESRLSEPPGHRQPQHIRAAAGRVL